MYEETLQQGPVYGREALAILPVNEVRHLAFRAQQLQYERGPAKEAESLIQLALGEPCFMTPPHIRAAACRALQAEPLTYGPAVGWNWLRDLLASKITTRNGYTIDAENTAVTAGGTGAIQAALVATVNPGEEVLIPDPAWPQYRLQLACCGARAVPYRLDSATAWLPDLDHLRSLLTPRTRLLIINSPANPTGAVFPALVVQKLLAFAQEHQLYLLSDECYDELTFDQPHISPASLLSRQEFEAGRVLCVYSFSKTYAMTGWRVGYIVASHSLMRTLNTVLDAIHTNVSKITQIAARAALEGGQEEVEEMRQTYRAQRDQAVSRLRSSGYSVDTPQGAFYLLLQIGQANEPAGSGMAFALRLLENYHTLVAPGSAFGEQTQHFVRISLASSGRDLEQGLRNILACLSQR